MWLPCSSESHVQSARIVEETDSLVFIGSDTRQDDEIFLSALEGINAGNLNLL